MYMCFVTSDGFQFRMYIRFVTSDGFQFRMFLFPQLIFFFYNSQPFTYMYLCVYVCF
jgi:hypothetical protein